MKYIAIETEIRAMNMANILVSDVLLTFSRTFEVEPKKRNPIPANTMSYNADARLSIRRAYAPPPKQAWS